MNEITSERIFMNKTKRNNNYESMNDEEIINRQG